MSTEARATGEERGAPGPSGDPAGLTEDVSMRTDDGLTLHGRWYHHEDASASAVLVHGFSASRNDGNVVRLAQEMSASGLEVLSYDARGHGESEGSSGCGSTEHLDVASATALAARRGLPIVLVGISMGAIAVIRHLTTVASTEAIAGVVGAVLISAPSRWSVRLGPLAVLTTLLTRSAPGRWAAERWLRVRVAPAWRVGETPESMVRRVNVPVAMVHGTGDRLLAVSHGERLSRAAGGPARLEVVRGMGHGAGKASQSAAMDAVRWVLGESTAPVGPDTLEAV